MTTLHNSRPELSYFVVPLAHQARSEAMGRFAYLAVDAIGRAGSAAVRAVAAGLRAATAGTVRWRERRAAVRILGRLDDRLLRDIGLTRGDLWAFAQGQPLLRADDQSMARGPAAIDAALSEQTMRGCNDNSRRQAA